MWDSLGEPNEPASQPSAHVRAYDSGEDSKDAVRKRLDDFSEGGCSCHVLNVFLNRQSMRCVKACTTFGCVHVCTCT